MVGDELMDEHERRDRQMIELLNELRVALPGVQLLFGFLLTVPFAQGFQRVTDTQRSLYYATLLAASASIICLIAPSATHRLRFHRSDRAFIIESANKYMIAGLSFLAIAIVLAVGVITDYLYGGAIAWLVPGAVALTIIGLWFARPVLRTLRGVSSGP
jgi:hypothetical protein